LREEKEQKKRRAALKENPKKGRAEKKKGQKDVETFLEGSGRADKNGVSDLSPMG